MRAMKRAFDGAITPMMQFMLDSKSLTEDELDQLEAMIKNKKEKAKKWKPTTREKRLTGKRSL